MASGHPFFIGEEDRSISQKQFTRVNAQIRAPEVRLINERGEMVGVKPTREALAMADAGGYDLIEIAPDAVPPVCRIGNLSKFLYEKEKKIKDSRKGKSGGQVKEIRMRPKIGEHDFLTKLNAIVRFLKDRHKVRVTFVFFGREMEHRDIGERMIERIRDAIVEVGVIEQMPQMYGNRMITILVPGKG